MCTQFAAWAYVSGGRPVVKRRIVLLDVATSSLILMGFLVPLAMLIRAIAADRAVAATTLEIQAMAPVVASVPAGRLRNRAAF